MSKLGNNTKLSNQAIATLMVTLQKCILEQTDITKMLQEYNFTLEDNQLVVTNPPEKLQSLKGAQE